MTTKEQQLKEKFEARLSAILLNYDRELNHVSPQKLEPLERRAVRNQATSEIISVFHSELSELKAKIDELWNDLETVKATTRAGSPARQFCRGETKAYRKVLSLLEELITNKE